jgi:hypothetical protein
MGRRWQRRSSVQATSSVGVSGAAGLSAPRKLWESKGSRGRSAEESWDVDYRQSLAALVGIADLQPSHRLALVEACKPSSPSRPRAGRTAALTAQALGYGDDLVSELRERGKEDSARHALHHDLPSDRAYLSNGRSPPDWSRPMAVDPMKPCCMPRSFTLACSRSAGRKLEHGNRLPHG